MRTMSASHLTRIGFGAYLLCFLSYANAKPAVAKNKGSVVRHDNSKNTRPEKTMSEETVPQKYAFNEKAGYPFCNDLLEKDTELKLAEMGIPQELLKLKMEERSKEFKAKRDFKEFRDFLTKGETTYDPPPEPAYEYRSYSSGGRSGTCFAPNTKVTILKDGLKQSVDIQSVNSGDFVLGSTEVYGFHEGLARPCWAKITELHEFETHAKKRVGNATQSKHMVFHKVTVIDGNGNSLDLTVTSSHPFFVSPSANKKSASIMRRTADLKVGDRLVNSGASELFVKSVGEGKDALSCQIDEMFDLEVEGVHNYFVGDNLPVLVHNK